MLKKSKTIKRNIFILLLATIFLLLTPPKLFSYEFKNSKNEYMRLIQTYKEWLYLEEAVFKKLSFRLSPSQAIKTGYRAKFILEDNLGRKWMFKPDYYAEGKKISSSFIRGRVAVIVYRIYKLFGLETARINYTALNINDKKISGSIQLFISNIGTLKNYPPHRISPNALNYLLKIHVINWLLSNNDSNSNNFLALSSNNLGKLEKIMRIDNEFAFILLGKDRLKDDWPYLPITKSYNKYYPLLWKNYICKKISLDLENNLAFIKFVSEFPNEFFEDLVLSARIPDFKETTRSEFEKLKEDNPDNKYFLEYITSRKNNLIADFKEFYKDLAAERGESLTLHTNVNYQKIIASVIKELGVEIKELNQEKLRLQKAPYYPDIDAIFSFEGFNYLTKVYDSYWKTGKKDLIPICGDALKNLSLLKANTKNKYENKALKIYMREIIKIHSGKLPSFCRDEINKVVESVIPDNRSI